MLPRQTCDSDFEEELCPHFFSNDTLKINSYTVEVCVWLLVRRLVLEITLSLSNDEANIMTEVRRNSNTSEVQVRTKRV
jgi:hypothetical protein